VASAAAMASVRVMPRIMHPIMVAVLEIGP
jgi:hypothetical protein